MGLKFKLLRGRNKDL